VELPTSLPARAVRLVAAGALVGGVLAPAPQAQASRAAGPILDVTFSATSTVTVTLPDGTPVGTTSGPPTVIPAGYYGIQMVGPGGCIQQPLFHLHGPGEDLINDMSGGEVTSEFYEAYLAPNSTYTWRTDNANPGVVYTFVTSGVVAGTAPAAPAAGGGTGAAVAPTSQDIVGSAVVPFRGTLTGAVSAAGTLTVAFRGRSVTHLAAGRYAIVVSDQSATSGFVLAKAGHAAIPVTTGSFVGRRSLTVDLTPGQWTVGPRPGASLYTVTVG
jgi:hypothetical protein